ncbi:MspA family porin [[Mycobacterium] wendilense]|uniref:MspA family porin n=1 Tax=[Mycobacterium] wendilense TaxID=3064284 RepID=A0ABN9NW88_9MYCO|nr:MspA family porin [Mycolicibacterium sp. MU0050]CAJ1581119.1 MspA family porin [Mycolicibacterium sp. MU0050]
MIHGRRLVAVLAGLLLVLSVPPANAEPEPAPEPVVDVAALPADPGEALADPAAAPVDPAAAPGPGEGAPPVDDAVIVSAPPATSEAPDGWTLTVGATDEILRPIPPLTTALSSRSYEVAGVFNGSVSGPDDGEEPRGVLEVGYHIGCGIDMSTSNGVTLTGSVGMTPSIGLLGIDSAGILADGIAPVLSTPISGGIAVGLKPGIIHIVPVTKKEYKGAEPWVSVNGFQIKIDGCMGESFIRSYAVLTRSTDMSDAIQAYYGTTKKV